MKFPYLFTSKPTIHFSFILHHNLASTKLENYVTSFINVSSNISHKVETRNRMAMAHSISPVPATAITPIAKSNKLISHIPSLRFRTVSASNQKPNHVLEDKLVHRRAVTLSLAWVMLGLNVGDRREANAAARRPPPPPPMEKKDPNVSGVLAKVLASKKRKEAMKESIAKLREKGKPVDGSPSPPPPPAE